MKNANKHIRNNFYTVISDVKYPLSDDNSTIDSYEVGIAQITDYSPFGVELDGRTIQNSKYRYSFQNQEHHDEIKGKGNYMNYKYRGYDPRIGRLDWTLDPLAPKYPYYSPYQFSGNRVIDAMELEGLEPSKNPKNDGPSEKGAKTTVDLILTMSARNDAEQNIFSRSAWSSKDSQIKGTLSSKTADCKTEYISDTDGDPLNKFNMKVSNNSTLYVDESQARRTNNYEAFIVHKLLNNFVTGEGAENYVFPVNGIISSKFLGSSVLNTAIKRFTMGREVKDRQFNFGGKELAGDASKNGLFSSIVGMVGSAQITITKGNDGLNVKIFNITSLYSGDISKNLNDQHQPAKSYVRRPNEITTYGNISQTFYLYIPNDKIDK